MMQFPLHCRTFPQIYNTLEHFFCPPPRQTRGRSSDLTYTPLVQETAMYHEYAIEKVDDTVRQRITLGGVWKSAVGTAGGS